MADAGLAQTRHELGGVGAEPVADENDAGERLVDRDQNLRVAAVQSGRKLRLDLVCAQEAGAADENAAAVDGAADAAAELLLDLMRDRQLQIPLLGSGDESLRERMRRESIERGREPQRLVGG